MIKVKLTPEEIRAGHDLLRSVLMPSRAREEADPALLSLMLKLRDKASVALCPECGTRPVYSRDRCEPCYRRNRRAEKALGQSA